MKRLQAKIAAFSASVIITSLVISGMLAIGIDANRAANVSTASLALSSTVTMSVNAP